MSKLDVIKVNSTSDLPKLGKLLSELPASGTVYVYEGQPIALRDNEPKPWLVIVRAQP